MPARRFPPPWSAEELLYRRNQSANISRYCRTLKERLWN
jgi:hypothetical protein